MAHLLAIHKAVNSPIATSKYALIVEDDVFFPFDVDYNALAAAAPPDFGILQLFTSNTDMMKSYWDEYQSRPDKGFWVSYRNEAYSTGFYLINREKLKPIINSIVTVDPQYPKIMQFKVIAGCTTPKSCFPSECCQPIANRSLACIHAPFAVADSYLYSMVPTYVSKLPLAFPDVKRDVSTIHADRDNIEVTLRRVITARLSTMLQSTGNKTGTGTVQLPPYMVSACHKGQPPQHKNRDMKRKKRQTANKG